MSTTLIPRVAVIIGSTRPTRICPDIARAAAEILAGKTSLQIELVDLADVDLPFLDEPRKPALGGYVHEHTRRWSATISGYDAFVFVFPQYNWGYPGVLKNAMDFLYTEWAGKSASCITYGTRGGGKGAAQLYGVLDGLHMRSLSTRVEVAIGKQDVDDDEQLLDVHALIRPYETDLEALGAELVEALEDNQSA